MFPFAIILRFLFNAFTICPLNPPKGVSQLLKSQMLWPIKQPRFFDHKINFSIFFVSFFSVWEEKMSRKIQNMAFKRYIVWFKEVLQCRSICKSPPHQSHLIGPSMSLLDEGKQLTIAKKYKDFK